MPGNYDPSVPDEVISVDDAASFEMTRRLAAEEGLLVGGSSGMAVVAGLQAAQDLGEDDVMVIILPDSGRGYLGKIFNEGWMRSHGFTPAGEGPTVREVLAARGGPVLAHVPRGATVREAARTLAESGVPQLPVLSTEPPAVLGEVVGAVRQSDLLEALVSGRVAADGPVTEVLSERPPLVGIDDTVAAAREGLAGADALLVTEHGHPVAVLTRPDLLHFLSE